ncbi:MAG: PKD domain-containing protein, partial [Chloroflexota bacterium]
TPPNVAQLEGPLPLRMAVYPAALSPGDVLTLDLSLTNLTAQAAAPQVIVTLPAGLTVDVLKLPASNSFNLQTNSLTWQPVVPAAGSVAQLTLPLTLAVADLTEPIHSITAVLKYEARDHPLTVSYWVGLPPQARIIPSPATAAVGQPLHLLADLVGPGPFEQLWDLGDGRLVNADNPTVVYAAAGTYQITLKVANPLAAVTATIPITIVAEPIAYFSPADATAGVNQPVTFVNQSGGQGPLTYTWDFGDGATSTEANPSHVYRQPGSYSVRLQLTSPFGQAETTLPITVGAPPIADLVIEQATTTGRAIQGQAFHDDTVTAVQWNLGDGRTLEGDTVAVEWSAAGDYLVTMTASNDFGQTQVSRWVHVEKGLAFAYLPVMGQSAGQALSRNVIPSLSEPLPPVVLPPAGGAGLGPADPNAATTPPEAAVPQPVYWEQTPLSPEATPAEQLFWYVNEARRLYNLPPLAYVYELTIAAQQHSDDMAAYEYNAHVGSDGSRPAERLGWYGYTGAYAGEAVAWGFERAIDAVEFWVNSPSHRVIILHPNANELGVGFAQNYAAPNIWYWTAEFGVR